MALLSLSLAIMGLLCQAMMACATLTHHMLGAMMALTVLSRDGIQLMVALLS